MNAQVKEMVEFHTSDSANKELWQSSKLSSITSVFLIKLIYHDVEGVTAAKS